MKKAFLSTIIIAFAIIIGLLPLKLAFHTISWVGGCRFLNSEAGDVVMLSFGVTGGIMGVIWLIWAFSKMSE